ncbi:amidohydrolase family protein [Amaricoccus sp.]|uniref:amidohydrolase family protein n=1 Tax=Amaricoccus sp. TaxID=1872485 RepID=UPI001B4693A8|nr:amidohydrolase family protein [Amaricoccus sp.]MBP7242955.1 amidohydrolase family protein [Amaricoccus sp.]
MPDFAIVDAHVHLYDLDRVSIGWLAGAPAINRSHGLADFDAARGAVAVERLVFAEVAVDAGHGLAEARWAQEIAAGDPRLGAVVAHAPVELGEAVEPTLEALAALPAVRGVRRLIQTEADPSVVLEPGFLDGVRRLARHGFSFDICVKHWQMAYAVELARRCPDVSFILDHIGKPDIRHGLREPWWSDIAAMARLPNVACKVSGVITEADPAQWTPAAIRPYVERTLEVFGAERCMFGSDWTVSELTHRYPEWVAILDDILAGASEAERRAFWRDTAIRAYRIDG